MPDKKTYYEVLGLQRWATEAEIKKRYRQLVRQYHPDVASDKAKASKIFIEITEAYDTLIDPFARQNYDAELAEATRKAFADRETTVRVQSQAPIAKAKAAKLVKDAELEFIKRRANAAADLCKQAIRLDMNCARAHAVLGDIYRAKKLFTHAISEYNYAVQFDPNDKDSQKKLDKLLKRTGPMTFKWEIPDGARKFRSVTANITGWGMAFFLMVLLYAYPGDPIPWLADYRLPLVQDWSWNFVSIVFVVALLSGLMLALNGILGNPDEELIFETGAGGKAFLPTAMLFLVLGPLFFPIAAILYLLFAFIQMAFSKSLMLVILNVAAIVILAMVVYPKGDSMGITLFSGNIACVGMIVGWYAGAILKPEF